MPEWPNGIDGSVSPSLGPIGLVPTQVRTAELRAECELASILASRSRLARNSCPPHYHMKLKQVFAWASYDLANTIFSALFVTFFFPFYIKNFLGGDEFQIGIVFGVSMLIVGIVAPVLGAISDKLQRRMPFIVFFTIVCCIFTLLTAFAGLYFALLFGLAANFCYHSALTLYNALLPKVSASSNIGTASGIGIALGYIGTIVSLIIAYPILKTVGWETLKGTKAMIITTAILFFAFSLILFFSIKEKTPLKQKIAKGYVSNSIIGVKNTFIKLKSKKGLIPFLLCLLFFNDALNAIIIFLFLYGRESIGLRVQNFFMIYALFALTASVGAYYSGKAVDKFGAKRILMLSGFIWIAVIFLLTQISNITSFIAVGSIGGIALGMTATAARPKLIELVPKENIGEYFGFFELTDKFSGVLGPIIFGFFVVNYGYSAALVSLIAFFTLGLLFLYKVPDSKENNIPV